MASRVKVIGCGVMAIDMAAAAAACGVTVDAEYLEAGLHDQPALLRKALQESIDRASAEGYDRIAVAYGLCGRGLVGIRAGAVPLVVPRVHDCIALFLGSNQAYRQQFAHCPGTFYISAGWFEKKVQPREQRKEPAVKGPLPAPDLPRLARKYGEENAGAIVEFLTSWRRNYRRVVFIDTGTGDRAKYELYARAMAEEYGWQYEQVAGNFALLEKLLTATGTTPEVLWVPPGCTLRHDPLQHGVMAVPPRREQDAASAAAPEPPAPVAPAPERTSRLGLGIDAGGTYTDVAIYDFVAATVLAKAKALTTKWDYTLGISAALDQLDPVLLARVDLVAVSTTLATNAIVEGAGQRVGLLIMPPGGGLAPAELPHRPCVVVRGRLEIGGQELEAPDQGEVLAVARQLVEREGVEAFAVSGYASTRNPRHELQVKQWLEEHLGAVVVCGHELSDQLNFLVRANTAALNARIIPLLRRFVADARAALQRHGLAVPLVVVKGDGSLMGTAMAAERPIETVLSGPAASVAGARFLTGLAEATVLDVGGTTSDLARLRGGRVAIHPEGAHVGGWQTHVRALDMRTIGLGGDSAILYRKLVLSVGPQRIAPISWLASQHPAAVVAGLDDLAARLGDFLQDTRPMHLFVRNVGAPAIKLGHEEQAILTALAEGPLTTGQLAGRVGVPHWSLLNTERLETHYLIQRCGLTPTDLLHTSDQLALWDKAAAVRLVALTSELLRLTPEQFCAQITRQMVERLAEEVLKRQFPQSIDASAMDDCPVCRELVRNLADGGNPDYRVAVQVHHPILGLGAPVGFYLPQAAKLLGAEVIIPPHADVANAVGAITSWVRVQRRVSIQPTVDGAFTVHGLDRLHTCKELPEAHAIAVAGLERELRIQARQSGTASEEVKVTVADRIATASDGTEVFLERELLGEIAGPPDGAVLAEALRQETAAGAGAATAG
jgi:N-methylhydantoinase A/oxoprolinase/acetone carboxylase beta subunit